MEIKKTIPETQSTFKMFPAFYEYIGQTEAEKSKGYELIVCFISAREGFVVSSENTTYDLIRYSNDLRTCLDATAWRRLPPGTKFEFIQEC